MLESGDLQFSTIVLMAFVVLAVLVVVKSIAIVPQQNAWVVERLGKFDRVLAPGAGFVIPFIEREAAIARSEGEKQAQINQAQGEAAAVLAVAEATASAIRQIAESIRRPGGMEAVNLRVAERYVEAFGNVAKEGNTLILPANVADMGSLVASAMSVVRQVQGNAPGQGA